MSIKARVRNLERKDGGGIKYIISSVPEGHPDFPCTDTRPMTQEEWVAKHCGPDSKEENNPKNTLIPNGLQKQSKHCEPTTEPTSNEAENPSRKARE